MRGLTILALVAAGLFGAGFTAAKRPCPGNSCHPGTSTTTQTTTVPTTTATSGGYAPPSAIARDCSVDVATSLNSWLATVPDGSAVSFGTGCYRVEAVIELDGRHLSFDGGTFKSFNMPDDQRPFFRLVGSTATFSGTTLVGSYSSGGVLTDSLQHAHGFDLRGSNVTITGANISDVAGDCVYYGLGYDNTTRSSGSFTNSTCRSIGRNGVSVTAGDSITISGDTIATTGLDGIDIEPNVAAGNWGSANVQATGNTISGIHLYAYSIIENAPTSGQTYSGNTGGDVYVGTAGATLVRPQNVTVRNNTGPVYLTFDHVDGLAVSGNTGTVSESDCTGVTA